MVSIRINGVNFGYDEAGAGPAVVLVHAGCADRRMWESQLVVLRNAYRVIRYDWRGYGESDSSTTGGATRGDTAGSGFAHHEDLLALMDGLGIERAVVVGASDGGKIALDAALTSPGRIAALVLSASGLSGHVWPPSMLALYQERVHNVIGVEKLRQYRAGQIEPIDPADLERYSEAETEFLVAGPGRTRRDLDPRVWELALDMDRQLNRRSWSEAQAKPRALQPPAKERLADVKIPTLVVSGLADVAEIQAVSDLLAEKIEGARRVRLPDTGHLPPLERPTEFNAALLGFLSSFQDSSW